MPFLFLGNGPVLLRFMPIIKNNGSFTVARNKFENLILGTFSPFNGHHHRQRDVYININEQRMRRRRWYPI
jgi:hypothetical protein